MVWVVDSRSETLDENENYYNSIKELSAEVQLSLDDLPLVLQFNHRDSQSAISVAAQGVTTAIAAPIQAISTAVGSISEGTNVTNNETTNAELKEIKNLLKQILNKEGTVYLDSNKVGTTLTTGFSTFKSQ
jgi:cell shape-determining protein MreC